VDGEMGGELWVLLLQKGAHLGDGEDRVSRSARVCFPQGHAEDEWHCPRGPGQLRT
jgi:hypothetical protein